MGASAGGVEAVSSALAGFPPDLRAAVLVVIHTGAVGGNLASVLGPQALVPVRPATDGGVDAPDSGGGHDPRARHELIPVTCPACGGALAETEELGTKQYECHIGHRCDEASLAFAADERVETVLWTAVRALQEKGLLRRRCRRQPSTAGCRGSRRPASPVGP